MCRIRLVILHAKDNVLPRTARPKAGCSLGNKQRVVPDFCNRIAANRVLRPEIRTRHDAGNTLEVIRPVTMPVSVKNHLRIVLLDLFKHHIPITDAGIDRVMRHEDERLLLVAQPCENGVEQAHVFRRPMAISHPHARALMKSDEPELPIVKNKLVATKELGKCCAAGFRPLRIMVARNGVPWFVERVEQALCIAELCIATKFGYVARENHERDVVHRVDVGNGTAQVLSARLTPNMRI